MATIPKLTDDLAIIQKLGDNPNTDNSMTAADLKAAFDAAPLTIQEFINNYIVPSINNYILGNGYLPAIESADDPGCYYRVVNNETEWINPPMKTGVEYRIAKRYKGKPVYTMCVDCGLTPAYGSGPKFVTVPGAVEIASMNSSFYNAINGQTHCNLDSTYVRVEWMNGTILINTLQDFASYCYVTLEYTKI